MKKGILITCLLGLSIIVVLVLSQGKLASLNMGSLAPSGAAQADVAVFVAGEQDFAFDLYRELDSQPGNLLFSPFSLYINLAMNITGAPGESDHQMARVLHATLPPGLLQTAAIALTQDVNSQAVQAMNNGASEQNYGNPVALPAPQSINSATNLVLGSTNYFNGDWVERFEPMTSPLLFTRRDGTQVLVPSMTTLYYDNNGHAAGGTYDYHFDAENGVGVLELRYKGGRISFIALQPGKNDQLTSLEASLTATKLHSLLTVRSTLFNWLVDMPKINFESHLELYDSLMALGMPDGFDHSKADLFGMNGKRDGSITSLSQTTSLHLNELGNQAAPASHTLPRFIDAFNPIRDQLISPFLFLILDRPTGSILFLGRIEDLR